VTLLRWLWLWGPIVAHMAVIYFASSTPNLTAIPGGLSDKAAHFAAYAVLAALALRGFAGGRWAGVTARSAFGALVLAAGYGVLDELHQRFVPGRHAAVDDWVADAAGAASAVALGVIAARVAGRLASRRDV
jgi:VanZ family protein